MSDELSSSLLPSALHGSEANDSVLLIASVTWQTMGFYPIEPSEMSGETPKQPQLGGEKWKRLAACPPG
ncbi:hypothetical protein MKX08_004552 [Trichoderma sp. CBMAI-0020]|nr:hypothetical protein MKX08_004552 [Trichoderma sp. CBMAI-0020]